MAHVFSDDPATAMEMAKAIIGGRVHVGYDALAQEASDNAASKWPRIAAIYALGFLADPRISPILREILSDNRLDSDVRAHAAEALGNIGDRDSIMLLKDILGNSPTSELRESCEYALGELQLHS
jgi:HEAT repeat protein